MRLIVNKNQYNKLLKYNNTESKLYEEWVAYIIDKIEIYRGGMFLSEEIICERNLNKKLKGKDFYEKLPINNIIFNVFKTGNKESCQFLPSDDSPITERLELDVFINNTNPSNTLEKSLLTEFFKIKERYENNN
tara:strand:- start:403 stop:804 length:402 start_codon:yes stop_codon:yes gene_type:complete